MCVDTTPWSVSDYLANAPAVGLPASNFVPSSLQSLAASVAQNSVPAKAPKTFVTACTGSLIARGIIYFKCNPGDCGTPTTLNLQNAQLAGLAGTAVEGGLSTAAKIAGAASGIAGIAGAALPGIGVAVQAITAIFANHAAAVANEQTTICKVAVVINQVIPFYDTAVRRGLISPSSAYAGMQSYLQQVIEALDGIQKSCDAACVYIAILQAHYNFVQKYYPLIAPATIAPQAPGAPPVNVYGTPGGILSNSPNGGSPTVPVQPIESTIYPLYGEQASGTIYILYGNTLYAVNILSNSIITPGYTFAPGILPGGYSWSNVHWVANKSLLPYPVSNTPPSNGIAGMSASELLLIAAVAFVAFMLISGKKLL